LLAQMSELSEAMNKYQIGDDHAAQPPRAVPRPAPLTPARRVASGTRH
jgi:hypothetical protein